MKTETKQETPAREIAEFRSATVDVLVNCPNCEAKIVERMDARSVCIGSWICPDCSNSCNFENPLLRHFEETLIQLKDAEGAITTCEKCGVSYGQHRSAICSDNVIHRWLTRPASYDASLASPQPVSGEAVGEAVAQLEWYLKERPSTIATRPDGPFYEALRIILTAVTDKPICPGNYELAEWVNVKICN